MNLRALLILLLYSLALPAAADPDDRWERRQEKRERLDSQIEGSLMPRGSERGIGPKEAARLAQERNGGGRVLDVVPGDNGWRVKLLKDGEVRTVIIPNS